MYAADCRHIYYRHKDENLDGRRTWGDGDMNISESYFFERGESTHFEVTSFNFPVGDFGSFESGGVMSDVRIRHNGISRRPSNMGLRLLDIRCFRKVS